MARYKESPGVQPIPEATKQKVQDVSIGSFTVYKNSPDGSPDALPKIALVYNPMLLYTYADDGPGIVRFIDPLTGCGAPDICKFNVALTGVPGNKSPVTYSTKGLWATKPLVDGSNPDASMKMSPLVLENKDSMDIACNTNDA